MITKNKIDEMIVKAVDWAWRIRDKSYGWGRAEGTHLAVIDAAEILYGLERASADKEKIGESVSFLKDQLRIGYPKWVGSPHAARTYAWILLCLTGVGEKENSKEVKACSQLISEFKEEGKGWKASGKGLYGYKKFTRGNKSSVYDTSISILALESAGISEGIKDGRVWLKDIQNEDGGWGFWEDDESLPVTTALACLALDNRKTVSKGLDWLREMQGDDGRWYLSYESTPLFSGDIWAHFSTPLCMLALIKGGEEVSSKLLAKAVSYLADLQSPDGGWPIMKVFPLSDKMPPFTWSTGNVLWMLSELRGKL